MRLSTEPLQIVEAGLVDYQAARENQRVVAQARADDLGPDTVFLLEHPSVYTAGRRTQPEDLPTDGTPVVETERGGRITWHGPGQLVVYPIVKLAEAYDVVGYVRGLEQAFIAVCAELGLYTGRISGRSGVWLPAGTGRPERKVAAMGVRVARGVTTHGIGLNCNPDMTAFDRIVPCGIADAGVTSLSRELDREVTVAEVMSVVVEKLTAVLDGEMTVDNSTLPQAAELPTSVTWQLDRMLQGG